MSMATVWVIWDGSNINFVGLSLGSMAGIPFLAVEPTVSNGGAVGSWRRHCQPAQRFPDLWSRLSVRAWQLPASSRTRRTFFQFLLITQTVVDSADPINWGANAAQSNSVLLQQVAGDTVVPNAVAGAPLSGTEPLIRVMGLDAITETTTDPMGIRGAVRMLVGGHGSLLDPSASPAATAEMQGQAASMVASGGTTVVIGDPSLIQTDD